MDRIQSPRIRHVSHPHAVSRHPALSPDGGGRPVAPSRLVEIRHRARRFSTKTNDAARTHAGLRLALSPVVFSDFDLAAATTRCRSRFALFGHVVSLQAFESFLAPFDQASARASGVATAG